MGGPADSALPVMGGPAASALPLIGRPLMGGSANALPLVGSVTSQTLGNQAWRHFSDRRAKK